jgi:transcriptional regulator with XRE-family HTH domain
MVSVEYIRKLLKENMKRHRDNLDWNQDDLAEESGLSTGYIKKIETGRQWPQPASLNAIAKALNISVDQLFIDHEKVPLKDTLMDAVQAAMDKAGYSIVQNPKPK